MTHVRGHGFTGFEPRTTPAERRAFFELHRRVDEQHEQIEELQGRQPTRITPEAETGITSAVSLTKFFTADGGSHVLVSGFILNDTGAALAAFAPIFNVPPEYQPPVQAAVAATQWPDATPVLCAVTVPSGDVVGFTGVTSVDDGDFLVFYGGWPVT